MANRDNIYYWKCDRPNQFFAIKQDPNEDVEKLESQVRELARDFLKYDNFVLKEANSQGNHRNYIVETKDENFFIRLENGPEADGYMEVETEIIKRVRQAEVPAPLVLMVDSSREKYPFAYQIMEMLSCKDLNVLYKEGSLNVPSVMLELGTYIARWQSVSSPGFGLFDTNYCRKTKNLRGLNTTYEQYYTLNLTKHLDFLVDNDFLSRGYADALLKVIDNNISLLNLPIGTLVHKDLAFWNVTGSENYIESIIDWDDAIMGDPTDDLSLMGCFHSWKELEYLLKGYNKLLPLPENFEKRFWLHLLRNMIFKSVIRVGANYFTKSDDFFLISSGDNAKSLKDFTLDRIDSAYKGLMNKFNITDLC